MNKRKALVVGIDNYKNVKPLNACINDAQAIAAILEMQEYSFEVTKLIDKEATRREIQIKLRELFDGSPDFVVFYFAGHGVVDKFGTYLVSVDAETGDWGIELDSLRKMINNEIANNTTVVIFLEPVSKL